MLCAELRVTLMLSLASFRSSLLGITTQDNTTKDSVYSNSKFRQF